MTDQSANLFTREDTLLGVCAGLGEELGINPLLPRVLIALALFWNPVAVIIGYAAAGMALAVFRWAFPLRAASRSPRIEMGGPMLV
ncbi:PspC domain-containing protein [Sphingomonas sp.]|uniref:PspC domain-containing protein n=1 Tax=Sphingomonas sp. TaxID=28214 RepID=UPI003CC5C1D9